MPAKEKLIEIIRNFVSLTRAEQALITECLSPKTLNKGDFLLKKGDTNYLVGFLDEGLMRSFYLEEDGSEITSGFFQEGNICTDLNSYVSGTKSERNIEALTMCQLLILHLDDLAMLRKKIPTWNEFEQNYITRLLLQKVNFQREMANKSTTEAYDLFTQTYRQAALFAPRYQIASFLGISPFTLSRLKNR